MQDTHHVHGLPSLPGYEHFGRVLTSSFEDIPVVRAHTLLRELGSHGMQAFKVPNEAAQVKLGLSVCWGNTLNTQVR